jgi:hypothetical protein
MNISGDALRNLWKLRNKQKKFIAEHFINENHPKTTIYRIIKIVNNNEELVRKKGSGRPPIKMPLKKVAQLMQFIKKKGGNNKKISK